LQQVGIKAVLHETQQEINRGKVTGEKRRKEVQTKKTHDLYTKNKGVAGIVQQQANLFLDRQQRDEVALAEESKEWNVVEAKLKAKSELYDKMGKSIYIIFPIVLILPVRAGDYNNEEDERGPLIDFERKNWDLDTNPTNRTMYTEDMKMEEERRTWEKQADEGWSCYNRY